MTMCENLWCGYFQNPIFTWTEAMLIQTVYTSGKTMHAGAYSFTQYTSHSLYRIYTICQCISELGVQIHIYTSKWCITYIYYQYWLFVLFLYFLSVPPNVSSVSICLQNSDAQTQLVIESLVSIIIIIWQ